MVVIEYLMHRIALRHIDPRRPSIFAWKCILLYIYVYKKSFRSIKNKININAIVSCLPELILQSASSWALTLSFAIRNWAARPEEAPHISQQHRHSTGKKQGEIKQTVFTSRQDVHVHACSLSGTFNQILLINSTELNSLSVENCYLTVNAYTSSNTTHWH